MKGQGYFYLGGVTMSDNIKDIKANYREVEQLLSFHYEEVEGEEFYRYIFPNNQNEGIL